MGYREGSKTRLKILVSDVLPSLEDSGRLGAILILPLILGPFSERCFLHLHHLALHLLVCFCARLDVDGGNNWDPLRKLKPHG